MASAERSGFESWPLWSGTIQSWSEPPLETRECASWVPGIWSANRGGLAFPIGPNLSYDTDLGRLRGHLWTSHESHSSGDPLLCALHGASV
jgi:hypothetical protein